MFVICFAQTESFPMKKVSKTCTYCTKKLFRYFSSKFAAILLQEILFYLKKVRLNNGFFCPFSETVFFSYPAKYEWTDELLITLVPFILFKHYDWLLVTNYSHKRFLPMTTYCLCVYTHNNKTINFCSSFRDYLPSH